MENEINRREFMKGAVGGVVGLSLVKEELEADLCKRSFYDFVQRFWSVVVPEEPIWNWHIKYLCNEFQKMAERVFVGLPKEYDLIINVPPGSTKSTIFSILAPAWIWTRMPSARIIGGSYSHDLSMDLSRKNRDVVLSDKYQNLFPYILMKSDQNVKSHFANTQGGGRIATSTGGTITGFHGHFIFVDDPLNPNEALSEVELKSANTWMSETLSQRKVDKAMTPTILIMQRLHQGDPTAEMLARAEQAQRNAIQFGDENAPLKIRHICLPGEKTAGVKPLHLRKHYKKGLLDPIRLNQDVLNEAKADLAAYGYAGQILQNPVPLGGGMFKTDRIMIETTPPEKWIERMRYWDKAGTVDGGAYTVGVLMGKDREGKFWILDCIRGQWGSEVRERIIKQTAEIDGRIVVIGVEQEPGSGGKESAESTVKNLAGWRVKIDKPSGSKSSKELRADPFSVQVNANNVAMVKGVWNRHWLEEHRFFPASTYKDQVDASSGAFNYLARKKKVAGGAWRRAS